MTRLPLIALLLLPQAAMAQEIDRQPIINIVRGSPATPGGLALLDRAESHLRAAIAKPENAAAELDADDGGFVRSVAAIAANAALAAQGKGAEGLKATAVRAEACADGMVDRALALAAFARAPGADHQLIAARLAQLDQGQDADGDGMSGEAGTECGMRQLRNLVARLAATAGL
ncbi:hypothetical protein [Iodidimonas sp. SYSU 1G8]|uniref:hypothetical protein n=1 Tax=Iodidimonas sp. SYSU 1G8 TaxID=3133967 RepID=UPI0031FE95AC